MYQGSEVCKIAKNAFEKYVCILFPFFIIYKFGLMQNNQWNNWDWRLGVILLLMPHLYCHPSILSQVHFKGDKQFIAVKFYILIVSLCLHFSLDSNYKSFLVPFLLPVHKYTPLFADINVNFTSDLLICQFYCSFWCSPIHRFCIHWSTNLAPPPSQFLSGMSTFRNLGHRF
jgi:hypothetical protein